MMTNSLMGRSENSDIDSLIFILIVGVLLVELSVYGMIPEDDEM